MRKVAHKITTYINFMNLAGVVGILIYALYVMWTREDTHMTKLELNVVLTFMTFALFNFAIFVFTD